MKSGKPYFPLAERQRKKFQKRLMFLWLMLTVFVFGAVMLILSVTGTLSRSDRRLHQSLETMLQSDGRNLNAYMDQLTASSLHLSDAAAQEIENFLMRKGVSFSELNDNPELLLELQHALYSPLNTALQVSSCSGVYIVLDATANTHVPGADHSRSGIYLRCVNMTGSSRIDPDVSYFRGIPEVARQKNRELHNRWNLEIDTNALPGYAGLTGQKMSRAADHYYWTEKIRIRDTWEEALLLCVPIVGGNRTVYGVCGAEVSSQFFKLALPAQETEFGSVVRVLAPLENGQLMLQKGLIGGVSGTYLDNPENLTVHQGGSVNTYTGKYNCYAGVQQLAEISMDHEQRQWVTALLMPEEQYARSMAESRRSLTFCILLILVMLTAISFLLYWKFLYPIGKGTAESVCTSEDHALLIHFLQTSPPVRRFGKDILPQNIEEVLDRFIFRASCLEPEERRLFVLLADGCDPAGLTVRTGLSRRVIKKRMDILCEDLGVSGADDLLFYIDFFRRCGRQEELQRV